MSNKHFNNNDFEDLYMVYSESRQNKGNLVSESTEKDEEEKDVEKTEEEDAIEEGLFNNVKSFVGRQRARIGSAKDTVGQVAKDVKSAATGQGNQAKGVGNSYKSGVEKRILDNHMARFNSQLSSLATDLVKLGMEDADAAEKFASDLSNRISQHLNSLTGSGNKVDKSLKRDFGREKGDYADRFTK